MMAMRHFRKLAPISRSALRMMPKFYSTPAEIERDVLEYDVVIVGAGPAGLSAAIRLKQLEQQMGREVNVVVLEKGSEAGAHILSGCCFDPKALDELFPDWRNEMEELPRDHASLQDMGVEIYAGFPAAEPLYDDKGAVRGVLTGDMGIGKDGQPKDSFTPGVEVVGKQTIFSEGCRGSCTKKLMSKFDLNKDAQEQTYALGVKGNKVHAGFVVGLDYQNPYLSIYEEFQRWKTHPAIAPTFEGGEVISYGARTITEGGLQCLPKLHMPGAMLAGDSAGTLIAARIKGAHTAMKMGMLSAEAIAQKADEIFEEGAEQMDLQNFDRKFKASWVHEELYKYRNFRPAVNNYGFYIGSAIAGFDQFIARGNLPFTLKFAHSGDHKSCKPAAQAQKIEYPKGDGKLTFDLLSNLILSGTNHEEDQPVHLHVKPETLKDMKRENFETFAGPEGRYCPARVYEWLENENGETYLQINASNCLHCKACSIKDYGQRIEWRVPEGGGGPQYTEM